MAGKRAGDEKEAAGCHKHRAWDEKRGRREAAKRFDRRLLGATLHGHKTASSRLMALLQAEKKDYKE
jgi:hypothetical protein